MVCQKKTSNLLDIHLVFDFRVLILETVLEANEEQSVVCVIGSYRQRDASLLTQYNKSAALADEVQRLIEDLEKLDRYPQAAPNRQNVGQSV